MANSILSTHNGTPLIVGKSGRPKGSKNGEGRGSNRANGGSSKDFAPSTSAMLRMQRPSDIAELEAIRDNGIYCTYCQANLTYKAWVDVTIDHLVPHARGGTNNSSNLVSACRMCNSSKSDDFTATQFAFVRASTRTNPPEHLAKVDTSIRKQITAPINHKLGNIVVLAWRELSEGMRTREEYRTITFWMVANRACEIVADVLERAA